MKSCIVVLWSFRPCTNCTNSKHQIFVSKIIKLKKMGATLTKGQPHSALHCLWEAIRSDIHQNIICQFQNAGFVGQSPPHFRLLGNIPGKTCPRSLTHKCLAVCVCVRYNGGGYVRLANFTRVVIGTGPDQLIIRQAACAARTFLSAHSNLKPCLPTMIIFSSAWYSAWYIVVHCLGLKSWEGKIHGCMLCLQKKRFWGERLHDMMMTTVTN